jgi:hypothetical protein
VTVRVNSDIYDFRDTGISEEISLERLLIFVPRVVAADDDAPFVCHVF